VRINPEKKEDRERVARELLRVTLRLAAAHGFVSLGLREVSRAAEIAPTSFYRHFADMEELGRELIEGLAGPFIAGWIASVPERPPGSGNFIMAVANRAIAGAVEDPEPSASASDLPMVAQAVVVLILGACGDVLDLGAERASSVLERLGTQIRALLVGATTPRGSA